MISINRQNRVGKKGKMLRRQLLRDVVLRAHVGNLRVSAVVARKTIAEGARRWDLPTTAVASQLWSEYMVGTVMLSSFFKGEERVKMTVRAPTNEEIYVEALAVGEVRGKATLLHDSAPSVFADGYMEVSKILYGETKPYVTTVPATGHAERDWQTFYDVSEQVPTVVRVGQATESDELRCCGLTIQKMPDSAPHDRRYDLSDLRFDSASFSPPSLADKDDLLEYLNELIPNADLKEDKCRRIPLDFYCRCSKKGFSERLAGLGEEQLDSIISDTGDKGIELTCHFCNELYRFSLGDLQAIAPTSPSSNL